MAAYRAQPSDAGIFAASVNLDAGGPGAADGDRNANFVSIDGGAATVLAIEVSPLPLVPAFSPSISDYYVRCAAGDNSLSIAVKDTTGEQTSTLVLSEDQEVSIRGQYWIRCLPHDFPTITVTTYADAGAPTAGWYLLNNGSYAMVLDTRGTPVWYSRAAAPANVDAPLHNVISFMPNMPGLFSATEGTLFELHALDTQLVSTASALGGPTDGHELRTLPNGNHLLFTYPIEAGFDLTGLQSFGIGETIADCKVQEVDPTGAVVWSWLASDHVDAARESIEPAGDLIDEQSVVDVFHCNSIDVDASGNLLLSFRHANALFYVDRATGDVLWKLGGTAYSKDGAKLIAVVGDPQVTFSMQHDARFLPNGDVSLFDDHGGSPGVARGVEYAIDQDHGTATLTFQFLGSGPSQYQGSFRSYADGERVVGWGGIATDPRVLTEVNSSGAAVLDIAFDGLPSYRSIKVATSQLDITVLRAMTAK